MCVWHHIPHVPHDMNISMNRIHWWVHTSNYYPLCALPMHVYYIIIFTSFFLSAPNYFVAVENSANSQPMFSLGCTTFPSIECHWTIEYSLVQLICDAFYLALMHKIVSYLWTINCVPLYTFQLIQHGHYWDYCCRSNQCIVTENCCLNPFHGPKILVEKPNWVHVKLNCVYLHLNHDFVALTCMDSVVQRVTALGQNLSIDCDCPWWDDGCGGLDARLWVHT